METDIEKHHFDPFPVLQTTRLTLRQILQSDADRIFEMRSNAATNRFILRTAMTSANSAQELITQVNDGWANHQILAWAGVLRDQQQIIGTCGFNRFDYQNNRAEIGGELYVNYWGKHIAIEAVNAILNFGFSQLNLHAIEAKVHPDNRGAILLLQRLGFEKEAHFKHYVRFNKAYHDMCIYTCFKHTFLPL